MADGLDIGTLTGRIELEDRLSNVLDQVGGVLGKFEGGFKSAGETILETATGFLTAEAAIHAVEGAIHLGIETLKELTIEGAAVGDVEENFNHLTTTAGRLGKTLLNELREGTHNTISDFELMKIANQDLATGLNLTDGQFRVLADGAFALAQATGESVFIALNKMNDAMLTGRARSLEMLTGKINLTKAEEDFAKRLNTTSDRLTEDEKLQAKREAILDNVAAATRRLGEQTDGLDEKIDQAKTKWANFSEELGKTVAQSPVILTAFDDISGAITEAFGGKQQTAVQAIASLIDEAAIEALHFAEVGADVAGIIGIEFNAAKVVFGDLQQIIDGNVVAFKLMANGVAELGALLHLPGAAEEVERINSELETLMISMVERGKSLQNDKKAQEEWAVVSGQVKDKIEEIRQHMIAVKKAHDENTAATNEGKDADTQAGHAADDLAGSQDNLGASLRRTAEEQRNYNEAWKSILGVGKDWHQTILQVNGSTVEAVKYYLDAGIALEKLKIAYELTDEQAQAINQSWKENNERLKEQKKDALETAEAWKVLNALGKDQDAVLAGVGDRVRLDVLHYADLGASVKDLAAAFKLTETQIKAITGTRDKEREATEAQNKAYEHQNELLEESQIKVKTLSGEIVTLAEAQARQAQGGSWEVTRGNLAQTAKYFGIPEHLAFQLAEKGFSFQEILQAWQSKTVDKWVPHGPRMPGFREGGIGDFGEGTVAMLHGKEAIIPLDSPNAPNLGANITIYVNGTAADVARKVADEIMRTLKLGRQFGAA